MFFTIDSMRPKSLYIKSGGGTYTSILKDKGCIVNSYVYSYLTQRYEMLNATYYLSEAYVDIRLFREFVETYGRPDLEYAIVRESKNPSHGMFENLNPESILKLYGYTVSDGASMEWRQKLLAEIIDLEILAPHDILKLLEFFIATHPSQKYMNAVSEWEADRKFLLEYRVNPERLMIAK